jgi:hypothetical protein
MGKDTGYICTAYFRGKDGLGTCNTGCQWWDDKTECVAAKGSKFYDDKQDLQRGRVYERWIELRRY